MILLDTDHLSEAEEAGQGRSHFMTLTRGRDHPLAIMLGAPRHTRRVTKGAPVAFTPGQAAHMDMNVKKTIEPRRPGSSVRGIWVGDSRRLITVLGGSTARREDPGRRGETVLPRTPFTRAA